jgi:hypothetical protein
MSFRAQVSHSQIALEHKESTTFQLKYLCTYLDP